jgi:hypothetical protein
MSASTKDKNDFNLEVLLRRKYGAQKGEFTDEDEAALENLLQIRYVNSTNNLNSPQTPRCNSTTVPSTVSTLTTNESASGTLISKASSGLVKILSENRAMKSKFIDLKIGDVETEIYGMDKDFELAAQFHATFILFIKYCIYCLSYLV